ncbi:MAG: OmpA family protein [Rhodospirillum sp.]|nr:OmpA family protein [Rhodospirillum sp.]
MTTFADLMSLLLTFFILLLSFAELDIVKYRQLAGALSEAFGVAKEDKMTGMIEVDGVLGRKQSMNMDPTKESMPIFSELRPEVEANAEGEGKEASAAGQMPTLSKEELEKQAEVLKQRKTRELYEKLTSELKEEVAGSGIQIQRLGGEVVISFPSDISFPSGSSALTSQFDQIIDRIIPALKSADGEIFVSGHTDDVPLAGGGQYQSNWDLSAARATGVVHRILEHGIDPKKITVQGYGDSRPIGDNGTVEGRSKNRRVEISIVAIEPKLDPMGNEVQ